MFMSQKKHLFSESQDLLQDRKFDTALRKSTVQNFIKKKDEKHHWTDDLIWKHHPDADKYRCDTTIIPRLMSQVFGGLSFPGRVSQWQRIWEVIERNMLIQHTWLTETLSRKINKMHDYLYKIFQNPNKNRDITTSLMIVTELNEVINNFPKINTYVPGKVSDEELLKKKLKLNQYESRMLKMKFTWSPKIVVIEWAGTNWILPKPYVLEMHNKMSDLVSTLLYASASSGINHPETFYDTVIEYLTHLCDIHINYPCLFFDFANTLEGLCLGKVIHKADDWINDSLWNSLLNETDELFPIPMKTHPLIEIINREDIDVISELSCLSKMTGHPLTDIEGGALKLFKRVNDPFEVSVDAISFCISSFKENFIRNFLLRFGRFPSLEFDISITHPAIVYCYPRGIDPLSPEIVRRFGRLQWQDWAGVDLLPEMKFNYCENVIPLLKDKAISVCRSKVFNSYLHDKFGNKNKAPDKIKFEESRVLLHYLFTSEMGTDHIKYIEDFCNSGEDMRDVLDYLVVRLVPKEKELKTKPRFFGCKTFMDRARTIVGEQNIATYLNLFCDSQGMTLSEISLVKKLYAMQNMSKLYKAHKIFKCSLDAEGWCTRQRNETNKVFASQTLDPIFGTNLFSLTHDAYERGFFYVSDELQNYWWSGQGGGIEGQNQNQWVTLYDPQMKYSFKDTAYSHHQIIHGDDYRGSVAVPLSSMQEGTEKEVMEDIIRRVAEAAQAFGHKIKISESYGSENILCYSKIVFFKGIQLPSAIRKIQKTYGATNAFLPILDDYIGSTFSNAHSACYSTTIHYVPYMIALFWTSYYLTHNQEYTKLSTEQLVALTLTPSVVGGMPMIYLHNMFVRGESDLLSSFIDLLSHCLRSFPGVGKYMFNFLKIPFVENKPYPMLMKDPYSLPFKRPLGMSIYLKSVVKNRLVNCVANSHVRELLTSYSRSSLDTLISDLVTSNEWQAKPITALYSSSPYHLIDELLSSFITAKSIMDLLISSSRNVRGSQKILKTAINRDKKLHLWRISVLRGETMLVNRASPLDICPALYADYLRNEGWGIKVTTITHPPPQHQVSFGTQEELANDIWALDNHFLINIKEPEFLIRDNDWHYADGGKVPFLGHATSAGTIVPTIKVSEKDPVASKVSNLLTLRSWMNKSFIDDRGIIISNFPAFIDKMLSSYTNVHPSDLQKFAPTWRSGSITHRLRAHGFRESVVPNNLMNLYTMTTGETNTHRHFRDTREDFTVNYLHIFCYASEVALLDLEFRSYHDGRSSIWIVTTPCEFCNIPIEEPPLVIEKADYLISTPPRIHLTELGKASIQLIRLAQAEYDLKYPTLDYIDDEQLTIEKARTLVIYECLKKSWDAKVSLSKRWGLHDMSSRGVGLLTSLTSLTTEKTLGETELRALPFAHVIDVLSTYIFSFFLSSTGNPYRENINAIYNTIIPSQLPWYNFVEWYYSAGLLRQWITSISDLTQIPAHEGTFYNVNTATIYTGKCLTQYAMENPIEFLFIPCTLHDTNETLYQRYLKSYTRHMFTHLKINHITCRREFNMPFRDLTIDQKEHIVKSFIMYARDPMTYEQFLEITEANIGDINMMLQYGGEFTVEEYLKINATPRPGIISHLAYIHCGHLVNSVNELRDDIDYFSEEDETVMLTQFMICRYPISACIDRVRSDPYTQDKPRGDDPDINLDPDGDLGIINYPENDDYAIKLPEIRQFIRRDINLVFPNIEKIEDRMENWPWSCYCRVLGSSISSCNKIHHIMRTLGIRPSLDQVGWVLCCGEGEGGILHHLLTMFPRCQGIFNTLIDDLRSGASAGICDRDQLTRGRYSKLPLRQGVSNLSEWSTIQVYLNEYRQKVWMFTCDADIREQSDIEIEAIWTNVIRWWLLRRTRHGCIIIKVFGEKLKIFSRCATMLSFYALHVRLIRTPVSHNNSEFFIWAQGTAIQYNEDDRHLWGIHPEIAASCIRLVTHHYEKYTTRKNRYDDTYFTECHLAFEVLSLDYTPRDNLLSYVITQKCRLPNHHEYLAHNIRVLDILQLIIQDIASEREHNMKLIRDRGKELKRSFTATETLRHMITYIDRCLALQIMEWIITEENYDILLNGREPMVGNSPRNMQRGLCDLAIQLPRINMHIDRGNPYIGIYKIDLQSLIHKISGCSLQLLGILVALNNHLDGEGLPAPNIDRGLVDEVDYDYLHWLPGDDQLRPHE